MYKSRNRRKRDRDKLCGYQKKVIFTKGEARKVLSESNKVGDDSRKECRHYFCEHCRGYHVTKQLINPRESFTKLKYQNKWLEILKENRDENL